MNRIVIIGNGFDLAHGLKTSYKDFIEWSLSQDFGKAKVCEDGSFVGDFFRLDSTSPDRTVAECLEEIVERLREKEGATSINALRLLECVKTTILLYITVYNDFYDAICNTAMTNWVDIEEAYYKELTKAIQNNSVPKLNEEFSFVRTKMIEYLTKIQANEIHIGVLKKDILDNITGPFNETQFKSISEWKNIFQERISWSEDKVKEYVESLYREDFLFDNHVLQTYLSNQNARDIKPFMLLPEKILLLNFNYTNTIDFYLHRIWERHSEYYIRQIHIHGSLDFPEDIIFGYYDEEDEDFRRIKKAGGKALDNIKKVRYGDTTNLRELEHFLKEGPYQVYLMGHSCGASDRTLLQNIFQQANCRSIQLFRRCDKDNYLDVRKALMQFDFDDKLLEKLYCSTLIKKTPKLTKINEHLSIVEAND